MDYVELIIAFPALPDHRPIRLETELLPAPVRGNFFERTGYALSRARDVVLRLTGLPCGIQRRQGSIEWQQDTVVPASVGAGGHEHRKVRQFFRDWRLVP